MERRNVLLRYAIVTILELVQAVVRAKCISVCSKVFRSMP